MNSPNKQADLSDNRLAMIKKEIYKFLTTTTMKALPRLMKADAWMLKILWFAGLVLGVSVAIFQLIR